MGWRLAEIELSAPLQPIALNGDEEGVGLVARLEDELVGFAMIPLPAGGALSAADVHKLAEERFAHAVLNARAAKALRARWGEEPAPPAPSLTIAICTKDRAARLKRLLTSLVAARETSPFAATEILVVDNAPSDESTHEAVQSFGDLRYVREAKAGLDFARNTALANATGDYLAFLDDDVVVDRHYLHGLYRAWRGAPDAGGFTGLVLPYKLETEAQVCFERGGGFGRGFIRTDFHTERFGNALHPVGAGILGAGCNMCFDRRLLNEIGGFDDALDTGAPLPGGGDLDIFYRALRSGRRMVYEPTYAVYHEHRETLEQLTRQYWTWGLGFMAFLTKARRHDPALRGRQAAMVWWWVLDRLAAIARSGLRGRKRELGFAWAEFKGGIQGAFGEYDRSIRRSAAVSEAHA
ncbi:MAG TPA: glycosyltransferase [Caulobacteraceae bacterium]|nr:glycosyltransferase [Caulobacteraceae bacterium]